MPSRSRWPMAAPHSKVSVRYAGRGCSRSCRPPSNRPVHPIHPHAPGTSNPGACFSIAHRVAGGAHLPAVVGQNLELGEPAGGGANRIDVMLGRQQVRPHAVVVPLPEARVRGVGAEAGRDIPLAWQLCDRIEAHETEVDGSGAGSGNDVIASKRSEEHTSELQSPCNLVCRLLLEKKKKKK